MTESPAAAPHPNGQFPPEVKDPLIYGVGRVICRPFFDRWFDLKVYGVNHVPRRGGVLLVSNHQSYLDPVLLAVKLPRPLSFMAKSELFENPYFGWLIKSLNAFPVRLGEGDIGAVKETIRRLQEGHALNVYPEGTRTLDGEIQPIQAGAGLIVRRAGVPVVPAAIHGSFEAWPKGDKLFHPSPIRVMYGPPMEMNGLKGQQIVKKIEVTLRTMFNKLRERTDAEAKAKAIA
jgi:1-acyl-sn-glycerol-3-phosphate acyltransferase